MSFVFHAPTGTAGYTLELQSPTATTVTGGTYALTEDGTTGQFFPPAITAAAGIYRAVIKQVDVFITAGENLFQWNGTAEVNNFSITALLEGLLNAGKTAFTAPALANAPSSGGGGGGLTAGQDTILNNLDTMAVNFDGLLNGGKNAYSATALANAVALTGVQQTILTNLDTRLSDSRAAKLDTVTLASDIAPITTMASDFTALLTADKSKFTVPALENTPAGGGGGGGGLTTAQATAVAAAGVMATDFTALLIGDKSAFSAVALANGGGGGGGLTAGQETILNNLDTMAVNFDGLLNGGKNAYSATALANAVALTGVQQTILTNLDGLFNTEKNAFSVEALANAPSSGGGGSGLTAGQATQLANLDTRITDARAAKLDTVTVATDLAPVAKTADLSTVNTLATDFTALLIGDKSKFSAAALENSGGGLTAGQATQLANLDTRITDARAVKLDTVTLAGDLTTIAKTTDFTVVDAMAADFDGLLNAGKTAFTAPAVENALGLTAGQATQLANLDTRITDARATKLDTVAVAGDFSSVNTLATDFTALLIGDKSKFSVAALENTPSGGAGGSGLTTAQAASVAAAGVMATDFTALLIGDKSKFSVTALENAPAGGGGSGGLTTAQDTILTNLDTRITDARAGKLDTVTLASDISPITTMATDFTALLTPAKTAYLSSALANAPAGGGGGGLTTAQATQLTNLDTRITDARAVKLDTVAVTGDLTNINTVSSQLDALLSPDKSKFTAIALADAPTGSGGGGGGGLTTAQADQLTAASVMATDFTALLTPTKTAYLASALVNAPSGGGGLTVTQETQLANIESRLSAVRAARLDTLMSTADQNLLLLMASNFDGLLTAGKNGYSATALALAPSGSGGGGGTLSPVVTEQIEKIFNLSEADEIVDKSSGAYSLLLRGTDTPLLTKIRTENVNTIELRNV